MPYRVFVNPLMPDDAPLTGWRYWVHKVSRYPFERQCLVYALPNGDMVCGPGTLRYLRAWLNERNVRYEMVRKFEAVK